MRTFNAIIDVDGVKVPFKIEAANEEYANNRAKSLFNAIQRDTDSEVKLSAVEEVTPLREITAYDLSATVAGTESGIIVKKRIASTLENYLKILTAFLKDAKLDVTTEPVIYVTGETFKNNKVKATLLTATMLLKHNTTVEDVDRMLNCIESLSKAILHECSEKIIKEQFDELETLHRKTSTFNVVLKNVGPAKLQVVKAVKDALDLGLKEAKDLVDGAPCNVKNVVDKTTAEAIKAALEAAGAEVEIK